MNIFSWLVLGHLLADWVFQNDWMAIGKRHCFFSFSGVIHYLLYTTIILIVLCLFSKEPPTICLIALVGTVVFVSHWLVDGTSIVHGWMQIFGQRQQPMVYIAIDQTLHLLILGVIANWLSS